MPVINRDDFPGFDFFPPDQYEYVANGRQGGKLLVVSRMGEPPHQTVLVASSRTEDPVTEDLEAIDLAMLLKWSPMSVEPLEEMKTIYKYSIPVTQGDFQLDLPAGAKILTARLQKGKPQMWVLVNTDMPVASRQFYLIGTGDPIKETGLTYVSTLLLDADATVVHLFEKDL